jgi:hypothetical protein
MKRLLKKLEGSKIRHHLSIGDSRSDKQKGAYRDYPENLSNFKI